ncbi:MAG: hypothetical protein KF752_00080 [Pirellulaceae bacterium]|nr:hypothetical protein [Pirellulaceae bacterium]
MADAKLLNSDVFIYNGDIHPVLHKLLRPHIGVSGNKRAFLLLTTPGGDADAAYRVARHFQVSYDDFVVGVWGACKSAGTLMAIGATELVIAPCGELGPLDVQVFSPDEFVRRSSGLSISQAIKFVSKQAFEAWEENFLRVRTSSGGIITTKTASEIANQLAIGLFAPITEKIDPIWIGELQRSIDIAMQYGIRLGMSESSLRSLIEEYPSHSFVIDYREADKLFKCVRRPHPIEEKLFENLLSGNAKTLGGDFLRDFTQTDLLVKIKFALPKPKTEPPNENHDPKAHTDQNRRADKIETGKEGHDSVKEGADEFHAGTKSNGSAERSPNQRMHRSRKSRVDNG